MKGSRHGVFSPLLFSFSTKQRYWRYVLAISEVEKIVSTPGLMIVEMKWSGAALTHFSANTPKQTS